MELAQLFQRKIELQKQIFNDPKKLKEYSESVQKINDKLKNCAEVIKND